MGGRGSQTIDARVRATLDEMYRSYPNTVQLAQKANGMLVMPLVTEAGLGLGGLAFALAAKDTAANLFGSVMIFLKYSLRK